MEEPISPLVLPDRIEGKAHFGGEDAKDEKEWKTIFHHTTFYHGIQTLQNKIAQKFLYDIIA